GRGAAEAAGLRGFVGDVTWGALDVLFVDLPPGLARFQELAELLPAAPAVLTVTIPTAESGDAVRRALRAALERGARPLGIVENMVGGAFVGVAGDTLARSSALRCWPACRGTRRPTCGTSSLRPSGTR